MFIIVEGIHLLVAGCLNHFLLNFWERNLLDLTHFADAIDLLLKSKSQRLFELQKFNQFEVFDEGLNGVLSSFFKFLTEVKLYLDKCPHHGENLDLVFKFLTLSHILQLPDQIHVLLHVKVDLFLKLGKLTFQFHPFSSNILRLIENRWRPMIMQGIHALLTIVSIMT